MVGEGDSAIFHDAPVGILIIFNIEQIDLHFGTLIMQQLLYVSPCGGMCRDEGADCQPKNYA